MTWKESFKKYAKQEAPYEACGLVAVIEGKEKFWPCKNLSKEKKDFFILDPDDWVKCEDTAESIVGVVHSHPEVAANPSKADKAACEHIGYPYFIYSIIQDKWISVEPDNWLRPVLARRVSNAT